MERVRYDVIVVGAGPAGVTAAAGIARSGASVLLIEGGAFAGAENWSGCVYFTESLLADDAFGADAIAAAPYERRVVRRGMFVTDGTDLVGASHQNPDTFNHCYTVLRPAFDPYWVELAKGLGVSYLPATTVTSLIRRSGRVTGVHTEKGPAYADLVFLAEGDASHLIRYEGLERVHRPDFMQGVKAVFTLPANDIERRFGISGTDGVANEFLVRNASLGGRSMHLNIGAFLYTNRESLSVGYVVPLKNLAEGFSGSHEALLAWVQSLPGIADQLEGAELSAFGAKLIRTGGLTQSPILVEDGLAVGGSAAGLGIDVPYPNFTGPAAATGLCFARAWREMAENGTPPTAANLSGHYLERLRATRYWDDADLLSKWPDYLESSRVLFGTTADLICGSARHLTSVEPLWTKWWRFGQFFRDFITPATLGRLLRDARASTRALGLPKLKQGGGFKKLGTWLSNSFAPRHTPAHLSVTIRIGGEERRVDDLPFGMRGMVHRFLSGVAEAMAGVYANTDTPLRKRMGQAAEALAGGVRLTDVILAGLFGVKAVLVALTTAAVDLFRFKVMKVPAERMLNDPVARATADARSRRELENIKTPIDMAGRLATNTYLEGATSHIRVLWPDGLAKHSELAGAPYWSLCPAGVYAIEPAFSGHGQTTVNFENCVKCESCWQAEPTLVRWGRHTDHRLIYRPETPAQDVPAPPISAPPHPPEFRPLPTLPERVHADPDMAETVTAIRAEARRSERALAAFEVATANLPMAADVTRTDWPVSLGEAAAHRLHDLTAALTGPQAGRLPLEAGMAESPFAEVARALSEESERMLSWVRARDLFEAVTTCRRVRETLLAPLLILTRGNPHPEVAASERDDDPLAPTAAESAYRERYPDREVKTWDTAGIDDDTAKDLAKAFAALPLPSETDPAPIPALAALRGWGAVHPGVAVLLLAHLGARAVTSKTGGAAVLTDNAQSFSVKKGETDTRLTGSLCLVPARLADHLVVVHKGFAYRLPLDGKGVTRRRVAACGLHPAAFETLDVDVTLKGNGTPLPAFWSGFMAHAYATVALGAGDYLARRSREHAEGRIQFPGQMQDPAGRNGIAKFGAVKTLVARTAAWRRLLACLLEGPHGLPGRDDLLTSLAAVAFSPKDGRMGYDAGQVFGGTGYSEDDLLARFYRDSAVFPYLSPGLGALPRLAAEWKGDSPLPLAARLAPEAGAHFGSLADGPLSGALKRWQRAAAAIDAAPCDTEAAREALAVCIGSFHLLTQTQEQLDKGAPAEGDAALLNTLLGELEGLISKGTEAALGEAPYPVAHFPELPDTPARELDLDYDTLIHLDDPYASGDFLRKAPGDAPRFVPEMQIHDPELRRRWEECYRWFMEHCAVHPERDAPYERYMEDLHAIPPDMLEKFSENGFFATVVPTELDGLGWKKADYYILVSGAMRFGDASLSLLIMASTSIGTTPALIGLQKEIPLVAKELGELVGDPDKMGAIQRGLSALVAGLDSPNPARLQADFTALMGQVDTTLRKTKVAKYLAQNFLKAFYGAGLAGRRKDFPGFAAGLREASSLLSTLPDTLSQALAELPLREHAAELFLRNLGHKGVAGFALTEPTAGSDSGGVATTGHIKEAALTPLDDGRYRFEIRGEDRFLLDAARIAFDNDTMAYRLADGTLAPISTADYDYATDKGTRTVQVNGASLPFHDIGQVRDGNRYLFYELTGAKMWITNGRVASQFSMYVKTDEGITGLLVDRHAEGLVVGRDEDKMGQKGSPTNELAIDGVRVPRECVIGYEGHGQVNALDTLNVGRCGLAVAGVVMARRTLVWAKNEVPESAGRDRVLAEVAARVFASESLCYHLIGRFDNYSTTSVRMESAIAKYVCSETLHEALDRVERVWGPAAQTQDHLIEKMRRDARILNIYEGTNEVQRFLILRELCAMANEWPRQSTVADGPAGELARWKETLRRAVAELISALGDAVWQDAALQTAVFPLAEMAGELYLLDCTIHRLDWLVEQRDVVGGTHADAMAAVGDRAVAQCLARLTRYHTRYLGMRDATLASRYPSEAVASDTLMEPRLATPPEAIPYTGTLSITCLLRPEAVLSPNPRVAEDGTISERLWRIRPADAHALAAALKIRSGAEGRVTVHAVSCGDERTNTLLEESLAAGADRATRLELPRHAAPGDWASTLDRLDPNALGDLIMCGEGEDDALLGAFVAGRLQRDFIQGQDVRVAEDGASLRIDSSDLPVVTPAVMALSGSRRRVLPGIAGHARAGATSIATAAPDPAPVESRFSHAETAVEGRQSARDVDAVADLIDRFAARMRAASAKPFKGAVKDQGRPKGEVIWVAAQGHELKAAAAAFAAARELGRVLKLPVHAVLCGNTDGIRLLAGLARDQGVGFCHALDTRGGALSEAGRRKVLSALAGDGDTPRLLAPMSWQSALAQVLGGLGNHIGHPLLCSGVTGIDSARRGLEITTTVYGGTLSAVWQCPQKAPCGLAVADTASFADSAAKRGFGLGKSGIRLAKKTDIDTDFRPPEVDLRSADVIVDVGYGAGSDKGMALAGRLMEALGALGLSPHIGATRKITQGLGLLPQEAQIGQTGVAVNPKLILCLGISGAPQHVDYLGRRAHLVAFNKDPDAPLMQLDQDGVTLHPVVGDLFTTVPALIDALAERARNGSAAE
ncbi:MAG: acyl-CoA dehydrogenase family protein [Leptospirillia bacterium]